MDYAAALASSFNTGLVLVHAFYMPAPVAMRRVIFRSLTGSTGRERGFFATGTRIPGLQFQDQGGWIRAYGNSHRCYPGVGERN